MPASKSASDSIIVLGIDPGYADLGYGVISWDGRTAAYIDCDNIRSSSRLQLAQRLALLQEAIEQLIATHHPAVVAVEKLFFFKNQTTAIEVAQARGVVLAAAARHHTPVVEYTPMEVKQSLTSFGHAKKDQVARMVKVILNTPKLTKKDDAIDALAIAICACFRRKLLR